MSLIFLPKKIHENAQMIPTVLAVSLRSLAVFSSRPLAVTTTVQQCCCSSVNSSGDALVTADRCV